MNPGRWNEQALSLIRMAVLAPSSHNTQPWRFRVVSSGIDLFVDRARALPINDPDDRELLISCGCALKNLRIAAANQGVGLRVRLFPKTEDRDWLARATTTAATGVDAEEAALFEYIERRRSYRKRFLITEVDSTSVDQLVKAADAEGAWLRPLVTDEARQQVATLVFEGDAAQWADGNWRRELAGWMRPRRRRDGLTVPALAAPFVPSIIRAFNLGGIVGRADRKLAERSPLLVVLGTDNDDRLARMQAGQALQRVLLTACQRGLQASHLNQPNQVAALRPRLQKIVGRAFPQILLRVGYPTKKIPAAPRRPAEEVVEWETPRPCVAPRIG